MIKITESTEDLAFAVSHPIRAFRARARQLLVAIEHADCPPPPGTDLETFPNLPLRNASELLERRSR